MADIEPIERAILEKALNLPSGYVCDYTNRTLGVLFESFNIDIHSDEFTKRGTSKANKFREFCRLRDNHTVAEVMKTILASPEQSAFFKNQDPDTIDKFKRIYERLLVGSADFSEIKSTVNQFNYKHMEEQIERMKLALNKGDVDLAIGTSKELIESCCKTILDDMNIEYNRASINIPTLVKTTLKELNLTPEEIDEKRKAAGSIKKILGGFANVINGIATLRNEYGTGHGRTGKSTGLSVRHAELAVDSCIAATKFIFRTHKERQE